MPHSPYWIALAGLLVAPLALAANPVQLTLYHADNDALFAGNAPSVLDSGHALVHADRTLTLTPGSHTLRVHNLPATVDPETISVDFGSGPTVTVLGQRVHLTNTGADAVLANNVGAAVTVTTVGAPALSGTLVGTAPEGVLIRTQAGTLHLVHRYNAIELAANAAHHGSTLLLDVDTHASGTRNARLTYLTTGLGWRAAYTAMLANGNACRMQLVSQASIANRSGRDYAAATITLIAGQPNLGATRPRMYAMAAPVPMAAAAQAMPSQSTVGDYRTFTLAGPISLPASTVTLTPIYPSKNLACTREYLVEDGGRGYPPRPNTNDYGTADYQDRPITSTLAFTAPATLPAGTLRAWTLTAAGTPTLLGVGALADATKDERVSVPLGQSFDLSASRERTAFQVDAKAHTLTEAYRLTLSNAGPHARTIRVREHPNRWRVWQVSAASPKPVQQTPQTLEFRVLVAAHARATITYTITYTWNAQDL